MFLLSRLCIYIIKHGQVDWYFEQEFDFWNMNGYPLKQIKLFADL